MILTLTPNAALDRILFIDEIQPGRVMRSDELIDNVGGKGLDVSVTLRAFGVDTLALSFVAGSVGKRLVALLEEAGVRHDFIWLEGETRTSHVVVEKKHQRHSHIIAGSLPIPPAAVNDFLQRVHLHLPEARWMLAGGSLPPGVPESYYRTISQLAHKSNVPFLLDSTGGPVLATLDTPPAILKMNWVEFVDTFELAVSSLDQLIAQAGRVACRYDLPALLLTAGQDGMIAITPEAVYHAVCPPQLAVNTAGAGDAASAALAWRLSLGDSWLEVLRWTVAVSAASVLTKRTAHCNPADVEELLPRVTIRRVDVEDQV